MGDQYGRLTVKNGIISSDLLANTSYQQPTKLDQPGGTQEALGDHQSSRVQT